MTGQHEFVFMSIMRHQLHNTYCFFFLYGFYVYTSVKQTFKTQTENNKKMKQDFYMQIIQDAPFGYAHHQIILDDKGKPCDYRFLDVNNAFEKLTGLKKENLIGQTVLEAIPGLKNGKFNWIDYYGKIALEGGQEEFEQFSEPLGRWYSVHVSSKEKMFFTTLFTDITSIKLTCEEVEGFFSVGLDLFCITDLEGEIIKSNEAWSRFSGYPGDKLTGMKLFDLVHPDDLPATLEIIDKLRKGEDIHDFSNRFLSADGTYRNIEWRAHPIENLIYASARDITEKKHLVEALSKSERRYRSLLEQMQDGLLIDDMHGNITYVNPRFCQIVEYDMDELTGRNGYDFLLPKESKKIVAEKDKNRLQGHSDCYELVFRKKSGKTVDLLIHSTPMKNEKGQVVGSFSTCTDISKLKRAERELNITKEAMQTAMQLTKVGRWSKNLIKNDDYWCKITREIHEVSSDFEPSMQNAIDFYKAGESRNKIREVVTKAINSGEPYDVEVQLITANGNERWVRTIGKPNFDENGRCIRLYGAIQDITEQKHNNEKLAKNERFLTQLNNLVFQVLGTENSDELLQMLSDNICALFNADGCYITLWDEHSKKTIPIASSAISPEEYRNKISQSDELTMTESVLLAEQPLVAEDVFNSPYLSRKIAEKYPARSLLGLPLISDSKKLGAILVGFNTYHKFTHDEILYGKIIARDISLIVHKMQIFDDLKLSNAQKDKFFSIIAHDLKSPFNSILGFSEWLVEKVKKKDFKDVDKYAGIIHQSSNHVYGLLVNLLEWSQAQTGGVKLNPEHFDLVAFVEYSLTIYNDIATQKSINIKRSLPKTLPVYADRHMLNSILRNLVSNAIKFTQNGGTVKISAVKQSSEIIITIADNGKGIPKERLDKLFCIAHSESTPGTANEKGTGLGLILCKDFIDKHGGNIWVESEEGAGSTFCFTIPHK